MVLACVWWLWLLAQDADLSGHWEGTIDLPGETLVVLVDLVKGTVWSGTLDVPDQSARGLPLVNLTIDGDDVTFGTDAIPGHPVFKGKRAGSEIAGDVTQSGQSFPFKLGRQRIYRPKVRPQDPKPPFPYRAEEVSYQNGKVKLAATLTIPNGVGPFPAVVLITGSGAQNRDEELLGHRPFLVIADDLTRAGIAVLRADDRGVGGSTGNVSDATTADFAADVLKGVEFLSGRPEIEHGAIGVLGHSEGGLVGPLAASASSDIAFVIMLAGTGVTGEEVLYAQGALIARAGGASEAQIADAAARQRELYALVKGGTDLATIKAKAESMLATESAALSSAEKDQAVQEANQALTMMFTPWFRYFITYDPRIALRKLTAPVLAINGELDLQVPADQNLPEIEKALREAKNDDVTIRRFAKMNHLFQVCATGNPSEYQTIEQTIDPSVLACIRDWIVVRFGVENR